MVLDECGLTLPTSILKEIMGDRLAAFLERRQQHFKQWRQKQFWSANFPRELIKQQFGVDVDM